MRVLPSRRIHPRDTLLGAMNVRVQPRVTVSQRCRECGFMAFRASETCPVCGTGNRPFAPLGRWRGGEPAAPDHGAPSAPTWVSRFAAAVRNAAIHRPRASSAPLLSVLTLVLLVGGYVTFDRTCRADPVCRGHGATSTDAADAGVQVADTPALPVLPAPVYAFRRDETLAPAAGPLADAGQPATVDGPRGAASSRHARASARAGAGAPATLARQVPPLRDTDRAQGGIRVADWKGGVPARRTHATRRVSWHARHLRRGATDAEMAYLYRGH
ncbi:TPA: ATP-dependent serine protease [Burkholderia vietnamiensis]|uniref:ATP-dependent serine protease n=1 Tax=Burkholderia vietnamiensis TaxID=60552 RepID=UPI0026523874|nr:ATP-dependent serine protease [Burkholderia vietnamiensis]MDN8074306.1 ATP-dependent serine protease [Burkholderia vietnamiensis]HDR8981748.1 ATP-dependent serine protease [Burkholderia vietnamiensis]